jgi:uncharacterized protein (DUF1330 family)
MSKAYLTVLAIPNPEYQKEMKEYQGIAGPLLLQEGGEIILRNKVTKVIAGESQTQMIILAQYPTREAIERIFNSDEYKTIIPLRDKGFSQIDILISEW